MKKKIEKNFRFYRILRSGFRTLNGRVAYPLQDLPDPDSSFENNSEPTLEMDPELQL